MMASTALKDMQPTPNAVLVQNISVNATEKAVKDFFSFCGKINDFSMSKKDDSQEAFILFDKESAANTARLLSNAVIVDRSVTVTSYFPTHNTDPVAAVEADEKSAAEGKLQGHKPYTRVIAELLAAGYTLSTPVVNKGLEIDAKYSVTKTLSAFFFTAQARAKSLDEHYGVTQRLKELDTKFHVSENAQAIYAKGVELGGKALATPAGQKVKEAAGTVQAKALEVANETKHLVDEQKAKDAAAQHPAAASPADAPQA